MDDPYDRRPRLRHAARTLGRGFLGLGHPVMIGSRDPAKAARWLATPGPGPRRHLAETAQFGELVVFRSSAGRGGRDPARRRREPRGKVLLDASDPLDFSTGRPGFFVGTTDSLGERIQRLMPAYVVKGLNIVLADVMVNPRLSGGEPDMFIAGDSDDAKQTVARCWKSSAGP